jgi:hypothetical protein
MKTTSGDRMSEVGGRQGISGFGISNFGIEVKTEMNSAFRDCSFGNPQSAIHNLKSAILAGALLLAFCMSAQAQQRSQPARIGFLATVPLSTIGERLDAFRHGLREHGYTEGENIVIDWRSAEGNEGRLPGLAAEMVLLNMQVIVSAGAPVTRALKAMATLGLEARRVNPSGLATLKTLLVASRCAAPGIS